MGMASQKYGSQWLKTRLTAQRDQSAFDGTFEAESFFNDTDPRIWNNANTRKNDEQGHNSGNRCS
jgi:hypothetical protein